MCLLLLSLVSRVLLSSSVRAEGRVSLSWDHCANPHATTEKHFKAPGVVGRIVLVAGEGSIGECRDADTIVCSYLVEAFWFTPELAPASFLVEVEFAG